MRKQGLLCKCSFSLQQSLWVRPNLAHCDLRDGHIAAEATSKITGHTECLGFLAVITSTIAMNFFHPDHVKLLKCSRLLAHTSTYMHYTASIRLQLEVFVLVIMHIPRSPIASAIDTCSANYL